MSAQGTGFIYPSGRKGLEPLDLEVGPGEIVAVLGPNGSGKSTLLRLLATDLRPTEGALSILGQPAVGRLARLRQKIGYAADIAVHFDVLTGEENAEAFRDLAPLGGAAPGSMEPLFRAFHLDEVSLVPVSEYSFGMRRKLLLLEALSLASALLLLDEPSVGLDPPGVLGLRASVEDLQQGGGTTIIASNEVRAIPMWAHRVLFLHRGRLVEDAALPELVKRLEGRTRIEIDLLAPEGDRPDVDLSGIEGVVRSQAVRTGLVVESSQRGRPLSSLAAALLEGGHQIRDVRVREPNLGDLFLSMTGESLAPETLGPTADKDTDI